MNVHIRTRPFKCRLEGCNADFNEMANRYKTAATGFCFGPMLLGTWAYRSCGCRDLMTFEIMSERAFGLWDKLICRIFCSTKLETLPPTAFAKSLVA